MALGIIELNKNPESQTYESAVEIKSITEAEEPHLWDQAATLRGRVYVDEFGWLPNEVLRDGRELDIYDPVSDHFVVHCGSEVFAHTRYIHYTEDLFLPVVLEYDIDLPRQDKSVEISRLISRHHNATMQNLGGVAIICHAVGYLLAGELDGYAILEKPLIRRVGGMGLILDELGECRAVSAYGNTVNYPVRIDAEASMQKPARPTRLPYARFFELAASGNYDTLSQELVDVFGLAEQPLTEAA